MIAEVLVDIQHQAVDQVFDYRVPDFLSDSLTTGMRVKVPFGARHITGVIIDLKAKSDYKGTLKPITSQFDATPIHNPERLALSAELARVFLYPRISYLNAMLPSALNLAYGMAYKLNDPRQLPDSLKSYFEQDTTVETKAIATKDRRAFNQALKANAVTLIPLIKEKATTRKQTIVVLDDPSQATGAPQKKLIAALKASGGRLEKQTLLKKAAVSNSPFNTLLKKNAIHTEKEEIYRELETLFQEEDKPITLNDEQTLAYETIKKRFGKPDTFLLHGVTASGKTEVYIKLIKAVLAEGKKALVLLPEIALTPKILARFKAALDNNIAVYHSALSLGEQYDQWRKMHRGEVNVAIGTRSAVFAPLDDLGIIIIDEEQSDSYTQNDHPEYTTRFVAEHRMQHHKCPLVLGSATPSIERYHEAGAGRITKLTLNKRPLVLTPPAIDLIDMKQEFISGNPGIFSQKLKKALSNRLQKNEKSLLLINRRGHSWFVLCRDCGKRAYCPECQISLTFHQHDNELKCHHCGYKQVFTNTCSACGSKNIRHMGLGSERVEKELEKQFPDARVIRMDKDTVGRKHAHEQHLFDFETNGDILVGTQMIAKGLDFKDVTLVGVLSADMGLFVPDHYAQSETFFLLLQIAGRAGRREKKGDVLIQTYQPEHPVLQAVKELDYEGFYQREIAFRKMTKVEPFKQLSLIMVKDENHAHAMKTAMKIASALKKNKTIAVIGPTEARFKKLAGLYQIQVLIRHDGNATVYTMLKRIKETYFRQNTIITITHKPRVF